ncbi:MAG: sulfotransferase [Anaerolineales bacterium]|nr:sulfotransferase [Anaerolineales bacterium]
MTELAGQATFICGHPKSGTSLLLSLLDSHPQLLVYPEESAYFRRFDRLTAGKTIEQKIDQAKFHLIHMFEWDAANPPPSQEGYPDRDYSAFSFEAANHAYRNWMEKLGFEDRNLLPAAMFAYGEISGQLSEQTVRWVEKTPYNEKYTSRIFKYWPDARCIQVIRDPRDNFTSYHKKHPDWSPFDFAYSWRSSTRTARKNLRRFGKNHYLCIRFEDLISRPAETMERVRQFLEIKENPAMFQPSKAGKAWHGNSMFGNRFEAVSSVPKGRWRDSLSSKEVRQIEAALVFLMRRWDYTLEEPVKLSDWFFWIDYVIDRRRRDRMQSASSEQYSHLEDEETEL